ncbi:hypothetical protein GCM10020367_49230 [Streptomyces sannanensis]|uniref:Uncharacterized protein n=1 Tax=Streptomyces sannanensis TaxID=285536 RepID=A0ABP6SHQ4_9ACTN
MSKILMIPLLSGMAAHFLPHRTPSASLHVVSLAPGAFSLVVAIAVSGASTYL